MRDNSYNCLAVAHPAISREFFLLIAGLYADQPGTIILYSGNTSDAAASSYLGIGLLEAYTLQREKITHQTPLGKHVLEREGNPWQFLDSHLSLDGSNTPGWFGYFSYEMGGCSDRDKELKLPIPAHPLCYFQRCRVVLEVNHLTNQGIIYYQMEEAEAVEALLQALNSKMAAARAKPQPNICFESCSDTPEGFIAKIKQAKEHIANGEIYQVNLSQEFLFKGKVDAFSLFLEIVQENPAPFSAFLNTAHGCIISSSPERFISAKAGRLQTRPIKGTAPRAADAVMDHAHKQTLLQSSKERAELAMITDLMRNDLGRVSKAGTVRVIEAARCEAYTNVFHLLSIVEGEAREELSPLQIIRECFPGGSITGCPKLRAMEIIAALEQRPRYIYTGAIGHIRNSGDFDFNIAIRTLFTAGEYLRVSLGSGIVYDSDPEKEYEETLHKGQTIFRKLGSYAHCIP